MSKKHLLSLATATALSLISTGADAASFQLKGTNTVLNGQAYSGTASKTGEVSLQFNNPALMTTVDKHAVDAALSIIVPSAKFRPNANNTAAAVYGNNLGGDGGTTALVPAVYGMAVLSPKVRFGLGITAPYGSKTEYDSTWQGRFNSIKSELKTININPAVAFQANKWFSIGGGLVIQYAKVDLTRAATVRSVTDGVTPLEAELETKGDDIAAGFNLGMLFDLQQGTKIGVAYRSEVNHGITGFVTGQGVAARAFAQLTTPDTIDVSISHDFNEKFSMHASYFFTRWNSFNEIAIRSTNTIGVANSPTGTATSKGSLFAAEPDIQGYKNAAFYALGAQYNVNDNWGLQLGVAYDETPIPDQFRSARLPGSNRTWVSVGVQYSYGTQIKAGISYSHLFIDNGKINADLKDPLNPGARLVGDFKNKVDLVGLNFTYKF